MTPIDTGSHMARALAEAARAAQSGEVPVGAVVVSAEGEIISAAGNRTRTDHDPSAHAEIVAIREACRILATDRLPDCDLYVTLEPCPMCATLISFSRIRRLYYGATDPKGGGVEHGPRVFSHPTCHHTPEIYSGIAEREAAELLRAFFAERR